MTVTMIGYSGLFIRFAWAVQPRNYILFACHSFNVTAQVNQLRRAIEYRAANVPGALEEMTEFGTKAAMAGAALAATVFSSGRIRKALTVDTMPGFVKNIAGHPAGPLTIFFWAPTSKWLLSVNNLRDLNKPTDKMSLAQQTALTCTGIIWTRYGMVINPVNYNLALVNAVLGVSSGYHLYRKIKADYFK